MIERKYMFHYIDAGFNKLESTDGTPVASNDQNYVRLGKDLEQYSEELNPQVSVQNNILGEQTVRHTGYQVSSTVEPYYAEYGDDLFEQVADIANGRIVGDGCETTRIDGLIASDGSVEWAYMEACKVIPNSFGGDTSGVQIPFQVQNCGNRHAVDFDLATKKASKIS